MNDFKKLYNPENYHIILYLIFSLLLSFLPFFFLKENSYIHQHDNLDCDFLWLHMLKISGNLFSYNDNSYVPQIMTGLSTRFFHSEFSFIRLLFYFFPSFWAYVLNAFLIRLIGLLGMYLILSDTLKKYKFSSIAIFIISISFALLPVYSIYGLTVLGQPLLYWSFFNILKEKKIIISFIIILFFPFYAHLAMIGPFILTALFLFGLFIFIFKKELNYYFYFGALFLLFFSFLLANLLTVENILYGETGHRTERSFDHVTSSFSIKIILIKIIKYLKSGHYHSSLFGNTFLIWVFAFYSVFVSKYNVKNIIMVSIAIFLITLNYTVYEPLLVNYGNQVPLLSIFNFDRFHFLIPFMLYVLLIINYNYNFRGYIKYIYFSILFIFCFNNIYLNKELIYNVKAIFSFDSHKSYKTYYAENLFLKIKNHIGLPQKDYYIINLGIHPALAQYNGFYTLDSYQNNYPLKYKKKFREIIKHELDKDIELKNYYDNWGNRVYMFSSELEGSCKYNSIFNSNCKLKNLNVNTNVLAQMGCRYILSGVKILNHKELRIEFEKKFEDNSIGATIFLYKLS